MLPPVAAGAAAAGAAAAGAAAAGAAAGVPAPASPPAPRLARYSAKDSALWMACCLPLGSFGSITVGVGSRVASPPPTAEMVEAHNHNQSHQIRGHGADAAMGSVSACAQPLPPLIDTWDRCMRDCGATGATKENGAATSSIMVSKCWRIRSGRIRAVLTTFEVKRDLRESGQRGRAGSG